MPETKEISSSVSDAVNALLIVISIGMILFILLDRYTERTRYELIRTSDTDSHVLYRLDKISGQVVYIRAATEPKIVIP